MNRPLTSDQIKTAQTFFGISPTGEWDKLTSEVWRKMKWEIEAWEPASWVTPQNWQIVFNEMVS